MTIVTAILSACAYGIAFGTLQVTVARVTPGLPEVRPQATELVQLRKEAEALKATLGGLPAKDSARKDLQRRISENIGKQNADTEVVKRQSDTVQFRQEMGGLAGRILLAILLIIGMRRVAMLRVFQLPAIHHSAADLLQALQ